MSHYLTYAEAYNLGPIEHCKSPLGPINFVVGANNTGKTTLGRMLDLLFRFGNDPTLLRNGAKEGWGKVIFDDGYTVTKRLFEEDDGSIGYDLEVLTPAGGVKKAAATFLEERLPGSTFNVDNFLQLKTAKQTEFLLDLVPIIFAVGDLNSALATRIKNNVIPMTARARQYLLEHPVETAPPRKITSPLDLKAFDELYDEIFSQRTKLHVLQRNVEGARATYEEQLGDTDSKDWKAERDRLQGELTEIAGKITDVKSRVQNIALKRKQANRAEYDKILENTNPIIESYVRDFGVLSGNVSRFAEPGGATDERSAVLLESSVPAGLPAFIASVFKVDAAKKAFREQETEITEDESNAVAGETKSLLEQQLVITGDLSHAKAKADEQERSAAFREAIEKTAEQAAALTHTDRELTDVLMALEALKIKRLSEAVPIPGFDLKFEKVKGVQTPVIRIDGIVLDRINTQERIYIAVQMLRLAKPECALILVESDGLDYTHMVMLAEAIRRVGGQMIAPRWIDQAPLGIMDEKQVIIATAAAAMEAARLVGESKN